MNNLNSEAFAQAETSFNCIKRLVNSWIPDNHSGDSAHDKPIKSIPSLYLKPEKISKAERTKQELEQTAIALEEEERGMKSGSVKKRKQNDVLNVLLIH